METIAVSGVTIRRWCEHIHTGISIGSGTVHHTHYPIDIAENVPDEWNYCDGIVYDGDLHTWEEIESFSIKRKDNRL